MIKHRHHIPIWPTNAVSIREAAGSATNARSVGSAIWTISRPSSSALKTFLEIILRICD